METTQARNNDKIQLVTFSIAEEVYGSEITKVQEIIWLTHITRVPKAPPHIIGVINLRGQIVPIISLTKRLNLSVATRQDGLSRIIVFKAKDLVAGIIVDAVSEVVKVNLSDVDPAPEVRLETDVSYIKSVAKMKKKVVIILDVEKVILGETEGREGVNVV